jgi:hypothetical protein
MSYLLTGSLPFVIDLFDAVSDTLAVMPPALAGLLQQNYLEKALQDFAEPQNLYGALAETEEFSTEIGTTLTKTRPGLKAPIQLATNASTAADDGALNNGITPSDIAIEQYTLTPQTYEDGMDLDLIGTEYAIVNRFSHNVKANMIQGYQTRDILARDTLLGGYLTGISNVTTGGAIANGGAGVTLGTPTNVNVDDIRTLRHIIYNGQQVSVGNTAGIQLLCNVYIGGSPTNIKQVYVVGAVSDTNNISKVNFVGSPQGTYTSGTRANGISGVLSLAMPGGATGFTIASTDIISAVDAPKQFLAGSGLVHLSQITASNLFTQSQLLDGKAWLGDNAMEPLDDGTYLVVGSERSFRQLYGDADFKQAFQGLGQSPFFKKGKVDHYLGVTFLTTTNAPKIPIAGGSGFVHVPIMIGKGALVDAWFSGMEDWASSKFNDAYVSMDMGIAQVITPPIDRLRRKLKQSWITIRDMTAPTDVTVNSNVILTAGASRRKRSVALVHGASV